MKNAFFIITFSWSILLVFTFKVVKAQSTEKNVANSITKSASFPGGLSALFKFSADSVKYPKSALAQPIKQTVGVQIDVDQDGTISHIITPPELNKDIEMEARRVVSKMPKWSPFIKKRRSYKNYSFF